MAWGEREAELRRRIEQLMAEQEQRAREAQGILNQARWDEVTKGLTGQGEAPPPHRGHPRFHELINEMARIHDDRNSDYANSDDPLRNFKACQRFGLTPFQGVLTRMSDKVERIYNLQEKRGRGEVPASKDDRLTDSLMDLACYALLGIVLLEQEGQE